MFINNTLSNVYIYQSWENLGTMDVSSRTGVICLIYKKAIKKILQTTEPSHSSLDAIIGAKKSAAIKKRTMLQTLSTIPHVIDEQLINN